MKIINRIIYFFAAGLLFCSGFIFAQGFGGPNISNQISRTVSSSISKSLFDRMLMPELKIRNESGEVKDFSVSADGRFFTLLHDDNTVRVWDARQGIQRPIISAKGLHISKVASVSKLDIALLAAENGVVFVYDTYTGEKINQLKNNPEKIVSLSVSKDESILAVAHDDGTVVFWDLSKMSHLKNIKTPYGDDLKFVKIESNGKSFIVAGEDGFVDRWSIEKAEKIVSLAQRDDDISALWTSSTDSSVASFDEDNIFQLSGINGTHKVKKEVSFDLLAVAMSDDLKLLAIATESAGIKVFDADSMRMLKQIESTQEMPYLQFINNSKEIIASDKKGVLHIFSMNNAKEIMKLISTKTGWTVVDNKGRFDSSEKGMVNVSWEVAEDYELPLDNFSSSHYEPGLLASHLDDQDFINKKPLVVQQGVRLPPQSKIIIPDGNRKADDPLIVSVEAQGQGNGVEEVKLYHNGKIVIPDAMVGSQQEIIDNLMKKTVEFKIFPTAGNNTFKVIATNKMGIEGHSEELSINFAGEQKKHTLHILTIGINKYKDERLNLDYSVADAAEIDSIFKKANLSENIQIVHHGLRDQMATKARILQQFNEIKHYSQNDVLLIYLAGHGIAVDGEWYFLPHETIVEDNLQYYAQVGVSAQQVQEILMASKVQHVMVMVDACYSGASLQAFRKMQDIQRRFSRGLSKSAGVVILAATRKDQEAAELSNLGHGLFTYVVSKGLGGKADLKPRNQIISAHEIADYSTITIPGFSKKYLGAAQEPTKFTMGSDFTLLGK